MLGSRYSFFLVKGFMACEHVCSGMQPNNEAPTKLMFVLILCILWHRQDQDSGWYHVIRQTTQMFKSLADQLEQVDRHKHDAKSIYAVHCPRVYGHKRWSSLKWLHETNIEDDLSSSSVFLAKRMLHLDVTPCQVCHAQSECTLYYEMITINLVAL